MERLPRDVGEDGKAISQTQTVYWCEQHGTAIVNRTCQDQIQIGWVTDAGDYIAKGIPNG